MPAFGKGSAAKLAELDPRLQAALIEAIKHRDFVIICGHRNEADQNAALAAGNSRLAWPKSKHNSLPSRAVDIAPYDALKKAIDWKDVAAFANLAGFIVGIAASQGTTLRWGGDWDADGLTADESFLDVPHLELVP